MLNINVMIAKVKMKETEYAGGPEMQSCCFHSPCRGYVVCRCYVFFKPVSQALESRDEFGLLGKPQSQEVEWIGSN